MFTAKTDAFPSSSSHRVQFPGADEGWGSQGHPESSGLTPRLGALGFSNATPIRWQDEIDETIGLFKTYRFSSNCSQYLFSVECIEEEKNPTCKTSQEYHEKRGKGEPLI